MINLSNFNKIKIKYVCFDQKIYINLIKKNIVLNMWHMWQPCDISNLIDVILMWLKSSI